MWSSLKGIAKIKCENGSSGLLENCLYVPDLGVSLISTRRLCKTGLKGTFDDVSMDLWDKKGIVIHVEQKDSLYVVKNISRKY